jgi:hypothetical protein
LIFRKGVVWVVRDAEEDVATECIDDSKVDDDVDKITTDLN